MFNINILIAYSLEKPKHHRLPYNNYIKATYTVYKSMQVGYAILEVTRGITIMDVLNLNLMIKNHYIRKTNCVKTACQTILSSNFFYHCY